MATTYFVTQAGAGSQNGSTLGNAWSVANFNTAGNWSSTPGTANKISPGDTVSINGTITSQLAAQGSGSAGNIITLLFASGAKCSAANWSTSGAINIASLSYITIDGGATGKIGGYLNATGTTNGIIENTNNGTAKATQADSIGILIQDSGHIIVQGMVIQNIYVRTAGGTDVGSSPGNCGTGVFIKWNGGTSPNNVTVTNCLIHDVQNGVFMDYGPGSTSLAINQITAYNVNWGAGIGDHGASSTLVGATVYDLYTYNWGTWTSANATVQANFHHNGIYCYAESGGTMTTVRIYNCFAGPQFDPIQSTAGIYVSGIVSDIQIYNNTAYGSATSDNPADAAIFVWLHSGTATDAPLIANNTAVFTNQSGVGIRVDEGFGSAKTTYTLKNNVTVGCATAIERMVNGSSAMVADYNLGYNLTAGNAYSDSNTSSANFKTFAQWQALGYDANGSSGNPNLSGAFIPQPTSAAIDSGVSLASFFTTDAAGVTRPQGTAWDMGSYEYQITVTSGNAPSRSLPCGRR